MNSFQDGEDFVRHQVIFSCLLGQRHKINGSKHLYKLIFVLLQDLVLLGERHFFNYPQPPMPTHLAGAHYLVFSLPG